MAEFEGSLNTPTIADAAYERIRNMIVSGALSIGSRIDEVKLSESLAVSRTPIRDALGKLRKEGLVVYRPHQGNFVRRLSIKEIDGLYVVREELEVLAVRLAAANLDTAQLARLAAIVKLSDAARENRDFGQSSESDKDMHSFFLELADNMTLTDALGRIDLLIQLARNLTKKNPDVVEQTSDQRHQIYEYLESGDVEGAEAVMREHVRSVRTALVKEVERDEPA